jgi:valyl-tRNA synthetase
MKPEKPGIRPSAAPAGILRLLHPFMPFLTEELALMLGNKGYLIESEYPRGDAAARDTGVEEMEELMETIVAIRTMHNNWASHPEGSDKYWFQKLR